jgi:hypothetical protein
VRLPIPPSGQNRSIKKWCCSKHLVPKEGLEPSRLSSHPPQGCVSTNSTTWAKPFKKPFHSSAGAQRGTRTLTASLQTDFESAASTDSAIWALLCCGHTGRSNRIRTCDPMPPRHVLYQTELYSDENLLKNLSNTGRGSRIRTCDIRLPKAALYQTEPYPVNFFHSPWGGECLNLVGETGLEPATPCPPGMCSTRLSYTPMR